MTSQRKGPLAGYRVLELGSTVAGPFCGRLMADFGADVIKVEPPEGDPVRTMGSSEAGKSLYAASIFRNKSLIRVDLRKPEGRSLLRDMARSMDVVVENFRPGTLEKWGLGYEELRRDNPALVAVRISGFGQSGPYSARPGYGIIGEAISGLRHITGDPDRPPARLNTSLSDYITGLYAAFGAVMALNERQRTGRGQLVDAALYECAFSFMEPHVPAFDRLGVVASRTGAALPGSVPNNLYVTQDGRHLHVTAMADPVFRRLCSAMGAPELASPGRWGLAAARVAQSAEVDAAVQKWVGSLPLAEVESRLQQEQVPAARIYTVADIFDDPHFEARDMLQRVRSDELQDEVALAGVVPKLGDTPGEIRHAGRSAGADTREVLRRTLGLMDEQIDALYARAIVA